MKAPPVAPAVIVHSLAEARATLAVAEALDRPVMLLSAPGAAAYLGAPAFAALVAEARNEHPDADTLGVLDCGDDAGRALDAINHGVDAIRLRARAAVRARVQAIAEAAGVRLLGGRLPALDLRTTDDADTALKRWLARDCQRAAERVSRPRAAERVPRPPTKPRQKP